MVYGIILAAGKGTRMKSDKPKCAFTMLEKPMVEYVVDSLKNAEINKIIPIIGYEGHVIKDILGDEYDYVNQKEQLGTGHAVKQALPLLREKGLVVIAFGDVPLLSSKTIQSVIDTHIKNKSDLTILSAIIDDPTGYGRIIRDEYGHVCKIVEEKDASLDEKKIKEVNASFYCIDSTLLKDSVEKINDNNAQKEYYLTDIIEILIKDGKIVNAVTLNDNFEISGINTRAQLNYIESLFVERIKKDHLENGVLMTNPNSIVIGPDVKVSETAVIKSNTILLGKTSIGDYSSIGPNTLLHNVQVGNGSNIIQSNVSDSIIKNNVNIGPFAHIRNECVIEDKTRVGNFVEMKNTSFGTNSKSAHLSYIGDAEVGQNVNFGCGTITVNYDGNKKSRTIVKDDVFIGCNSNLIAPVELGKGSYIAAGSTINVNVPENALAIARTKQINKEGYAKRIKKSKTK